MTEEQKEVYEDCLTRMLGVDADIPTTDFRVEIWLGNGGEGRPVAAVLVLYIPTDLDQRGRYADHLKRLVRQFAWGRRLTVHVHHEDHGEPRSPGEDQAEVHAWTASGF